MGLNAFSPGPLPFPATAVTGTPGNDVICLLGVGGQPANAFFPGSPATIPLPTFGLGGDDTIFGTPGADDIYGGSGDDVIWAYGGNDYVSGGPGDDIIRAGAGNDTVDGNDGNDTIYGETGADDLYGGNDNDTIEGGDGADYIEGGNDEDELYGGNGPDEIHGGRGADYIAGQNGNDLLFGGEGNDTINGNDGQDIIFGDSEALPNALAGCCGRVLSGPDPLGFQWWAWSTDFNFWAIEPSRISAADTINGGRDDDFIDGEIGNDTIMAGQGDDIVWGGLGADSIAGNEDEDELHGDEGFWRTGTLASIVFWNGANIPVVLPTYNFASFNRYDGGDTIDGGSEDDLLFGGPGRDALDGGAGIDVCDPQTGGGSVANCELVT